MTARRPSPKSLPERKKSSAHSYQLHNLNARLRGCGRSNCGRNASLERRLIIFRAAPPASLGAVYQRH
jgi:hypothetical protein